MLSIFLLGLCLTPNVEGTEAVCPPDEIQLSPKDDISLPIIMFHSTFKKNPNRYNIPPKQLEKDIEYILERGYVPITVRDLIAFQERLIPLPSKPIMLTFDDGYTNNYLYAFPILKEYKVKCVMSVIGVETDKNYSSDSSPNPTLAHVNYEQIKEMSLSGYVEIQSHTYNMHACGNPRIGLKRKKGESAEQYKKALSSDLTMLNEKLASIGISTTAVAYPFGASSPETAPILQELGFKASFSCREGINELNRQSSLFNLKRFNRPYGKSAEQFYSPIFDCIEKK